MPGDEIEFARQCEGEDGVRGRPFEHRDPGPVEGANHRKRIGSTVSYQQATFIRPRSVPDPQIRTFAVGPTSRHSAQYTYYYRSVNPCFDHMRGTMPVRESLGAMMWDLVH